VSHVHSSLVDFIIKIEPMSMQASTEYEQTSFQYEEQEKQYAEESEEEYEQYDPMEVEEVEYVCV
jgi:hypothetical protein